jgi:hypothetical protein
MSMFTAVTDVTSPMPSMAIPLHRRAHEDNPVNHQMNAINQPRPEVVPGLLLTGERLGPAYNEETFRYFLSLEEKRSDRSSRPLLLVLVDVREDSPMPDPGVPLEPGIAGELFAALRACLRETDFVGWYREGHVAGAVLTHIGDTAEVDISALITRKVGAALHGNLPPSVVRRLQVVVNQLPLATDRS